MAVLMFLIALTLTLFVSLEATANNDILWNAEIDKCTAIVMGKKAGMEGPMTTHTADCSDCDFRLNKVPAMDFGKHENRTLYQYKGNYPATVTSSRGSTWNPKNLEGTKDQIKSWGKESIITGHIPQVAHTYALLEAGYAIMNEWSVAMGESTCASRLWAAPVTAGGKARIEIREMSRIALERSKTAREAILIMGQLAEELGFYAADWVGGDASKGEGGEALTVIDKTEAWVFHVLADDSGESAVWCAQRVPDDHVSVVANQFVIRDVDPDSDMFLYSANMFDVAKRNGFWDGKGTFSFVKAYAQPRAHSAYSTRRVWRVFGLAAPSIELPGETDILGSDYPFSVPVDAAISVEGLMNIQRDHYEGTQYDLTKGIAAGPFGDPNRFDISPVDGMTFEEVIQGSYERSISMFRTSYSFVANARDVHDALALLWFGQNAPSQCSYAPIYVAAEAPLPYTYGSLFKYDNTVPFWNFLAAGNYAARFYKYAFEDVKALQSELMKESLEAVAKTEASVQGALKGSQYSEFALIPVYAALNVLSTTQALKIVSKWRDLLPQLITKYHDGYIAGNLEGTDIKMKKLFYSKEWLGETGYWNQHINTGDDVILFGPSPFATSDQYRTSYTTVVFTAVISSLATLLAGAYYIRSRKVVERHDYITINL